MYVIWHNYLLFHFVLLFQLLATSFILSFTILCFGNLEARELFGLFWCNLELDSAWDIDDWSRC